MKSHVMVTAGLGLAAALASTVAVGDAPPPTKPPIHFLALHLPKNLHDSLDHIQHQVQARIKEKFPSAVGHIHYHSHANRHVSLVRFTHIPHANTHVYHDAIAAAVKKVKWGHDKHAFDLSSKVRGKRTLLVTDEGWIIIHIDRSDTLTHFADEVAVMVHKKRPQDPVHTDKPDRRHISIARVEPGVSIDKLRQVLGGQAYEVKCDKFEVHNIHLQHSVGFLEYKEDMKFEVPGQP